MRISRLLLVLSSVLAAGVASLVLSASRPNTEFDSYVLFATDQLKLRGITVLDGNLGVNNGDLEVRRELAAVRSEISGKTVTFLPPPGPCHVSQVFSTVGVDATSPCGTSTPFTPPVLGTGVLDLARACRFPAAPIQCDGTANDVFVAPSETLTLTPGTYRNVLVRGTSGGGTGTLILQGGEYTFCSLRATRETRTLFTGPTTVRVAADVRIGDRSFAGPNGGSTLAAKDIRILSTGQRLSFRQRADVHALFCAPLGRAHVGPKVVLEGQLAARVIRVDRDVTAGLSGAVAAGTTTTISTVSTTTSSTSTTRPVCGNGRREGNEVCDPPDFGTATCPGSSVAGAFLQCRDSCSRIDFNTCPGAPTTTSSSSTSTSSSSSTSSSTNTLAPPRCGDGIVNGNEVCDPPDFGTATCPGSSVVGANLGCSADCMRIDTIACPASVTEVCGNCIDDDGNGLTDFEDPACCAQVRTFRMALSRGRIIPGVGSSALRLRSILARAGLARVDPRVQDVFLQLKPQGSPDVLCAHVPAGKFVAKGRAFRFVDKLATVASARGVTGMVVRIRPDGSVRFRARGKQVHLGDTAEGMVRVTVGFRTAGALGGDTRCSTTTQAFRTSRKGGLLAP